MLDELCDAEDKGRIQNSNSKGHWTVREERSTGRTWEPWEPLRLYTGLAIYLQFPDSFQIVSLELK